MTTPRVLPLAIAALVAICITAPLGATETTQERWDKDVGKLAPELIPAAWIGSPISLAAVRGNTIVIVFWNADSDGKIAYNASKGWKWTGGPNAGKFCHQVAIDDSLARSKGVLGIEQLPDDFLRAAHFFDLQQFMLIEPELKGAQKAHPIDPAYKDCIAAFHERIAASRHARVERITALSTSDPLQGYREAVAFVQAFGDAPERAEVNDLGKKLLKEKTVKRELQAEDAYNKVLVPIMTKTSSLKAFDSNLQPALDGYLKAYRDTGYAHIAELAVAAHGDAIRKPNR
ncbi:MAG: hypothetical protein H0W83_15325 [Planctomycetes bacterium]|nr:hypothetical protein [Planctomycetota bacterium]